MSHTLAKADIAIIGAGVMGASIARALASSCDKKIVVIDQSPPLGGMSARTFGQIRLHYSNELTLNMAMHGYRFFNDWSAQVGYGSSGYRAMGYLLLVVESQLEALHRNIDLAKSIGIDTEFVTPTRIKQIEPHINTQGLVGGVYDSKGGYIDITRIVLSLLMDATQNGAEFLCPATVTALDHRNGKICAVHTDQGKVTANHVICATGSWANELLTPLAMQVPMQPHRLDTMFLRQPPGGAQIGCCITDGNSNVAIRPDMGRDFLVGAYPSQMPLATSPDEGSNDAADQQHMQRIRQSLAQRLPDFVNATALRSVSGTYDITPDWHPIIDWIPAIEGLMVVTGFSGHGLKLSPAVGQCVSAMVLGNTPPFNLHPLRLSRFAQNDLMHCAYGPGARA
ncbi:MAG: FAD-binding oxidoreductase [Pseudomonadota bacterium]